MQNCLFRLCAGRVDQIQQYAGFILTLFASLAITCAIVPRIRKPGIDRPFRTWGYPVTPLPFLTVSVWTLIWNFRGRPVDSFLAPCTVIPGGTIVHIIFSRGNTASLSSK